MHSVGFTFAFVRYPSRRSDPVRDPVPGTRFPFRILVGHECCSSSPKKIVLAYSGGLDTSVILPWLKSRYPGVKLYAFAAELGQGDELEAIEDKARKSGADGVLVKDLRKEFAEEYCFPMLRAHATYEQDYLLGTSIARPLIAKHQVLYAQKIGADAVAHGATGKGNDQVRFELTYHGAEPGAADHLAVEGPAVPRRRPHRPRDRHRLRAQARHPDPADQEEDLLAGPQPVAHQPRGRRDRGSRRRAQRARLHDQRAAVQGAQPRRVRDHRLRSRRARSP